MKIFKKILVFSFLTILTIQCFMFTTSPALAQIEQGGSPIMRGVADQLSPFAEEAYKKNYASGGSPVVYISSIINTALGLMGIVFMAIIIYAGWLWLAAAGNQEDITKAKKWIKNCVIGIIIIMAAYIISSFVINSVLKAQGYKQPSSGSALDGIGNFFSSLF